MCTIRDFLCPVIRKAIRPIFCKPKDDTPVQQNSALRSSDGFFIQSSDNKILAVK